MKKKLQTIANQLSESDIQEIIKLKKMGDKKTVALRKKRDRLAAQLAKVDEQLAKAMGEEQPRRRGRPAGKKAAAKPGRKPGKKPGRKPGKKVAVKAGSAKKPTPAGKTKSGRTRLSAAVQEVFRKAGTPLKASQVVDGLPAAGVKVKDVAGMRKRISVVLASQKSHFQQVERGLYELKG